MLKKEMTKVELEKELSKEGDYVKIDNITRLLKENPPLDIKKFLLIKLIEVYESRKMYNDAADASMKLIELINDNKEKKDILIKQVEFYIKAGFFDKVDLVIKKIIQEVNPKERALVMLNIKQFYKEQALMYESQKRKSKAIETYEKILTLNINENEKREIEDKLVLLYKELGKVGEFIRLQKKLERNI